MPRLSRRRVKGGELGELGWFALCEREEHISIVAAAEKLGTNHRALNIRALVPCYGAHTTVCRHGSRSGIECRTCDEGSRNPGPSGIGGGGGQA